MIKQTKRRSRSRMVVRYALAVSVSVILASGCATTTDFVTGERVRNTFTIEEDIELGNSYLHQNIAQMNEMEIPVNEDAGMLANLENITKRIASVSDLPDLPYTVTLFQCGVVNAAAAPGGAIMVYEGLYNPETGLVKNNLELAAVIAHEIAHVTCRHGTEQMTKAKTTATVGKVLSTTLGVVVAVTTGDARLGLTTSDVSDDLINLGANLWFPAYNRQQEYEADKTSLTYLAKARINPGAALEIWKRAAENSKDERSSIFASHPNDKDRLKRLEEYLPEAMKIYEMAGGDRKAPVSVAPLGM